MKCAIMILWKIHLTLCVCEKKRFMCCVLGKSHLHVRVGEATGRQIVCVHGHRLLLGSQVLILVQGQRIHRALVVQAPVAEKRPSSIQKRKTNEWHITSGSSMVVIHLPTGYGAPRGGVGAGHHPGARHCHSMLLKNIKKTKVHEPHQDEGGGWIKSRHNESRAELQAVAHQRWYDRFKWISGQI